MRNDTYLYTDGLDAARRSGQIALWRASHQANIACKKAIEDSIRQGFDGVHLKENCAKEVLEEFGFKRVNWVLANTIQEKSGDGRFRPDNRSWAQRTFIPEDMGHKVEFIVNSHSEVVNGFVNQVREAYQKLGHRKISFGMPMMDLGAVPMPLVVLSAVPAWEMENIPDGTDPTSSESCRRIFFRSGLRKN